MSTSLGRLSVGMILEDRQFRQALDDNLQKLDQARRQMSAASGTGGFRLPDLRGLSRDVMGDLVKGTNLFGSATRDVNKYLGSFVGTLGSAFGPAGIVAAGVVGMAAITTAVISFGEATRDIRLEKLQEAGRIIAEINGQEFRLSYDLMTSAQAGEHLSKVLGQISEAIMERTIGFGFREIKLGLADLAESAANFFLGEEALAEIRRREAEAEAALQRARKLKEEAEQRKREEEQRKREEQEAARAAQREQERLMQEMQRRAEDLRRSLRTPMEALQDDIREAQKLAAQGLLNEADMQRAAQKWAERIRQIKEQEFPEIERREVARAIVGGSAADISFRLRMQEERRVEKEMQQRSLMIAEAQLEELRRLNVKTEGMDVVRL